MDTAQILATILSSGVLSSALVFLFRNWISERIKSSIQHEYDQKLETHKAQLKAEADVTIAKLKSELQIAANDRNIKLTRVFEVQAEVIAKTYSKLVEYMDASNSFAEQHNPDSEKREMSQKLFWQKEREFNDHFRSNRIYFPIDTANLIDDFYRTVRVATMKFSAVIVENQSPDSRKEVFNSFIATSNQVPKLLKKLEDDFQNILGLHEVDLKNK